MYKAFDNKHPIDAAARDALISTGLIFGVILAVAAVLIVAAHHLLRQGVGTIVLISFLVLCAWAA